MFALGNRKTTKKLENLAVSQNIINTLKLYQQSIATNAARLKEKMNETKKIIEQQNTESSKEETETCNNYAITAATNSLANSYINAPSIGFNGIQLLSLYNIPSIKPSILSNSNEMAKKVKIAIIIAHTYPKLKDDLYSYWTSPSNFGPNSTPPNVTIYTTPGATINSNWSGESCMDLQIICTVNPNADIYVVEAKSSATKDLLNAVNYAENNIRADVLSMSWGGDDSASFSGAAYSSYFSNPNICYCAASGDANYVSWPAVSSNCVAVGGTTLLWTPSDISPASRTEFTWPSAGCGYSKSVLKPAYQNAVNTSSKYRCIPDLSLVSNPVSGIHIICAGKWNCIGGTSAAAPIFAGMLSIANQQRFNSGKSALTTTYPKFQVPSNNVQQCLYNPDLYKSMFADVVIGTCVGTGENSQIKFSAVQNFDIATGLGSPNCAVMCNNLFNL
uniref:Peptidase S53 domain-containing protein n=1 Tax=viral metagenome TaxID=1070528 RepID=A0A6C0JZN7_9ZZZZ